MATDRKAIQRGKSVAKQSKAGNAKHTIRIIGGQWKRTPVAVVDGKGLRPTPERVRETLFNWLNHLLDSSFAGLTCLDMFAGTGALGFEAASRGFRHVTLIEKNWMALKQLRAIQSKLNAGQVEILPGDAFLAVRSMLAKGMRFDLICLDPPFQENLLPEVLPLCGNLLTGQGLVYVESDAPVTSALLADYGMADCLQLVREGRAGQVYYHLLKKTVS